VDSLPSQMNDFLAAQAEAPDGARIQKNYVDQYWRRMFDTPTCAKCGSTNIMDGRLCLRCRHSGDPVYRQEKWDRRYLELAQFVSGWSKDPSTKTGAVVVDEDGVVSVGFNGFAPGVNDAPERYANRELKYKMVVHCTVPWHKTLTKNLRWVEQGSLKVGDELVGFDEHVLPGKLCRDFRTSVVERVEFAKEPTYRVVLDNNQELFTTADHRWLTTTRVDKTWAWKRTDELRTATKYHGAYVTTVAQVIPVWQDAEDYESGWLGGLIDGEGTLGEHHTIHFAQRPGVVLDTALDIIQKKSMGHSLRLVDSENRGGLGKGDTRTVHIRGRLADRLALMGTVRPKRLLAKVDPNTFGRMQRRGDEYTHKIHHVEPIGEHEVVKLTTSTGTLFIEGYPMHNCEVNAVLIAERRRLKGATLYTYPFISCSRCAVQMIRAGIKRCVGPLLPAHLEERWGEDLKLTRQMFQEAGVELHEVEFEGVS
jgi:deoxycytidylate deaminase